MRVHFTGIGGIGISALAKYYLSLGASVSGSDLTSSEITEELKRLGAEISIGGHKKINLPQKTDKLIYTSAAERDNPEILEAKRRGLKTQSYAEAVGELTKVYKTVAVSGAHGKSTTAALAALVLIEGHFDPMVVVGAKIKEFGNSNFRAGKGGWLVLEADEWNRTFFKYRPFIAAVTNIDAEHLDTYQNVAEVEKAFKKYLAGVSPEGKIVANADDARAKKIAEKFGRKTYCYSLKDKNAAAVRSVLRVSGEHNVSNALAAAKIGELLGINRKDIMRALHKFSGAERRFELKGALNPCGALIFSDYAHHPSEIKATIAAARKRFPFQRLWFVYQPHQRQRLSRLWKEFESAFDLADKICLLPVYEVAGRENKKIKTKADSPKLAAALRKRGKNASCAVSFAETEKLLRSSCRRGDVVIVAGAGDIHKLAEILTI